MTIFEDILIKKFKNKNILIGVTGGIGVSKVPQLLSMLKKCGANIRIIMTENSTKFVTPLTMETISNSPVYTTMWESKKREINHISLKDFPDLTIIVPATANIIGKFTSSVADDLLSTTLLGIKTPIVFIPAMNTDMWNNVFFQKKLKALVENGYYYMEPASGMLACGVEGKGRMPEVEEILEFSAEILAEKHLLSGKKVLLTLGATREWIDDVRFISNPSSGKMGKFLAEEFIKNGADLTIIAAHNSVKLPENCKIIKVNTACDMYDEVLNNIKENHIFVSCAAVCDFRPEKKATGKIKKENKDEENIKFVKNPDILKETGKKYGGKKFIVGFAAETDNHEKNALKKLENKKLDMLVLNDVSKKDRGFESDNNEVTVFTKNKKEKIEISSKKNIAAKLVEIISENVR